ncbi:HipA N-terminal domain-containing protein [Vibrio sp. B1Z05]|uniref:HipA N-terminal domain-containing protein n=1 Tax=Vibrio sp. B1Z05 TaxID=2654980 RepID=UPI00128D1563|nr:HipA N-terminal domain-containing protein [Vibrio sp. B1Z05]MPW37235.1 type II toxin-antitoxin system HipA family toxin [Vibrio sp. B1Z05]
MDRKVKVLLYGEFCGVLTQSANGYVFEYDKNYRGQSLSLSLPVSTRRFETEQLHPYFKSLAPEGWLKRSFSEQQKIDERDILGMLIANGYDLLGAVQLMRLDDVS